MGLKRNRFISRIDVVEEEHFQGTRDEMLKRKDKKESKGLGEETKLSAKVRDK